SAPIEACRARSAGDLYQRADAGDIKHFPGVNTPYEAPDSPDLVLATHELDADACVDQIMDLLRERGFID
ncbi:MAG: adenylyl-sulfate kinase, partial [Phycisphaerae bacterium]|nr:adenylyl-sulfate kinase [Phycisphaerae bacterium]